MAKGAVKKPMRKAWYVLVILALAASVWPHWASNAQDGGFDPGPFFGNGSLYAAAWSPDDRTVAVGSSRGVYLYFVDFDGGQHWDAPPVTALYWHPDGSRLATLTENGVILWDVASGTPLRSFDGFTGLVGWNADGSRLAVVQGHAILILDAVGEGVLTRFTVYEEAIARDALDPDRHEVTMLAWSPDGKRLMSGFRNLLSIWDAATGIVVAPEIAFLSDETSLTPGWSPDGSLIALSDGRRIQIFDVETGERLTVLNPGQDFPGLVSSPVWSHDGTRLAVGTPDAIVVWDTRTFEIMNRIDLGKAGRGAHERRIVAWHPDGNLLLTATISGALVFDLVNAKGVISWTFHNGAITALAWNADSTRLAVAYGGGWDGRATGDHRVRIWLPTATLAAICDGHDGPVNGVAWSPDGAQIVSVGGNLAQPDGSVRLWDANTCALLKTADQGIPFATSVAWHPDGKSILTDIGNIPFVWDTALESAAPMSEESLWQPVWSPDGSKVAGLGFGSQPVILDAASGKILLKLEGRTRERPLSEWGTWPLAWSPDGSRLAEAGDRGLLVWDAINGDPLFTLNEDSGQVTTVAWSPDGAWLASGSAHGVIQIWDARSGEAWGTLVRYNAPVRALAWSPDGRWLAGGSHDGIVQLWSVGAR